ncbi:ferredoxin [Sporanaerobium hydrogeniformans]|uniref:Ferredoxin n=1 Tax=Sporanaerobium hydrogeniformans TaxID=3072179 RepID=A0AC61DEI8_9FIRM|nr:RnfABCDGE type electron transport complex subunit B [Sporanaerobium hydrogeniformans]PHV71478.1 ferredoxin [Sporanaerobium hydrogeniformans]
MDISAILFPVSCIGGLGLIFGVGLGIAAKKFAVPIDERVEAVKDCLPGANCGGCGFAGCEALAKAIVNGESLVNACPVCNKGQIAEIAQIMGVEATNSIRKIAFISCKGTPDVAKLKFKYEGILTCQDAQLIGGGPKVCSYGCLGYGSCVKVCQFDALTIVNGLPVVDKEKCVGCGACQKECPREIIQILPEDTTYQVSCMSQDKGKDVKAACSVGCIGCGICMKQCEVDAIKVKNSLAHIDQSLCIGCGKCETKCPTKAISALLLEHV